MTGYRAPRTPSRHGGRVRVWHWAMPGDQSLCGKLYVATTYNRRELTCPTCVALLERWERREAERGVVQS